MRTRSRHRHYGIDWDDEGWTFLLREQFCRRHHQMSSGREAHHPDAIRVNAVFARIGPHMTQSLEQVVLRVRIAVATEEQTVMGDESRYVCRSVTKHESRNAFTLQPTGYGMPLRLHIVPEITTARTDDHSPSSLIARHVWSQLNLLVAVGSLPDVYLGERCNTVAAYQTNEDDYYCEAVHELILFIT